MPDPSDSPAPSTKAPEGSSSGDASEAAPGKTAAATPPIAEPLSLVPRARSASALAKDNAAAASAPAGGAASFGDFVNWMKVFAAAMETAPTAPPPPAKPGAKLQRSALPKEQRRLQSLDREPVTTAPASPAAPAANNPALTKTSAVPSEAATAVEPTGEAEKTVVSASPPVPIALTGGTTGVRRVKAASGFGHPYFGVVMQVGVLLLLILSFVMGRVSVPKAPPAARDAAPAAPGVAAEGNVVDLLNPDAAKMIDQAMAAEQDRKFTEAAAVLTKVQKANPQIRDIDFRLALLALEANDAAKALPLLNLSISQNEQAAAAYKLRGTILNRRGGATKGMSDFENATKIDPFSAENFYFWGEALRKAGKPQAALEKLQKAIDRLREPELEMEYRLKIRLTQVELGQEQAFAAEMATKLAENPPAPDWLLTAAAVELHQGNFAAAASFIEKASGLMDKELFGIRLRDYYFYSYRFEKPLARFYAKPDSTPAPVAAPTASATPTASPTATPSSLLPALPEVPPILQNNPSASPVPAQPDPF